MNTKKTIAWLGLFLVVGAGAYLAVQATATPQDTHIEQTEQLAAPSRDIIIKKAEQGDADAQNYVGGMYLFGEGVPIDEAEAMRWYLKAAAQGHDVAHFHVGSMYYLGEGVAQDYAEAMRWYRKAAERGETNSQYNLGVMYRRGEGVPQNEAEAVKWFRKAAEQGYAPAQQALQESDD